MSDHDEEIGELLRRLDHPSPSVRVHDIIARGRSARRWRAMPIAAAAALCIASAAAALPGSPLRRALTRALGIGQGRPAAVAARGTARVIDGAGVTVTPGRQLNVRFIALRRAARLSIDFVDAEQASMVPRGGDAAFAIGPAGIVISGGTASDYVLAVPRTVLELRVQLDTAVIFRKAAGRVVSSSPPDSGGAYTLELTRP